MAQFDLYTITTQLSLILLGFFFFYIFLTKYFLVQIKRQEYILNSIIAYKTPSDNFLIINSFTNKPINIINKTSISQNKFDCTFLEYINI